MAYLMMAIAALTLLGLAAVACVLFSGLRQAARSARSESRAQETAAAASGGASLEHAASRKTSTGRWRWALIILVIPLFFAPVMGSCHHMGQRAAMGPEEIESERHQNCTDCSYPAYEWYYDAQRISSTYDYAAPVPVIAGIIAMLVMRKRMLLAAALSSGLTGLLWLSGPVVARHGGPTAAHMAVEFSLLIWGLGIAVMIALLVDGSRMLIRAMYAHAEKGNAAASDGDIAQPADGE